jgi:protein TonB
MFEGSLIESRGLVITRTQQWTTLGSITFQCALAGLLIAVPLLRPQALPTIPDALHLSLPLLQKPPVEQVRRKASADATAISVPAASAAAASVSTGNAVWLRLGSLTDGPAPPFDANLRMSEAGPGPLGIASLPGDGTEPSVVVERAHPITPVRISSGVSKGMLLTPIQPVYPAIAREARAEGAVVMEAVISRTGRIESLRAISGPQMLRSAALTAVEAARYRPYLLNGEPTEVQTTITVIFQLGG